MQNAGANPSEPTSPLLASHHHAGGGSPYTGHHGTSSALGAAGAGALGGAALARAGSSRDPHGQPPASDRAAGGAFNDGASTVSRSQSTTGESGPFSGADAAIMADAFRKALRKPDFAGRPVEEGESPGDGDNGNRSSDDHDGLGVGVMGVMNEEDRRARERERERKRMMSRELAEEGRDIRSVASSRGVRVETMSDSGSTVQDHGGRND